MKKTIKLALVLSTIALFAVSCTVRTYSIPGTYENDKLKLTVNTEGDANISSKYEAKIEEGSVEYSLTSTQLYYGTLYPWDLGADKAKQEFEIKKEVPKNSGQSNGEMDTVTAKYIFTKDGDNMKCEITVSGGTDANKIKNGSITLTKSLK